MAPRRVHRSHMGSLLVRRTTDHPNDELRRRGPAASLRVALVAAREEWVVRFAQRVLRAGLHHFGDQRDMPSIDIFNPRDSHAKVLLNAPENPSALSV